ncbi:MAG: indolepyruvate ferredoxin oxidoreductase, partial [Gammaproteobacteria bacterium]
RRRLLAAGERVEVERLGVDNDVCVGDHSCMRVNGCPSLSLADSKNKLKTAPVAAIDSTCVGCGVCGEIAHAAQLCPSFHKVTMVHNIAWYEKVWLSMKSLFMPVIQPAKAGQ